VNAIFIYASLALIAFVLLTTLVVAFSKNLLRSAFALFGVLFGIGGVYGLLGADFIALVQVLVYAGGVSVLLIFGTMFTKDISENLHQSNPSYQNVLSIPIALVFGAGIWWAISKSTFETVVSVPVATTESLGRQLLGPYLLPFEVVSFLLLAAMVGAIVLISRGKSS